MLLSYAAIVPPFVVVHHLSSDPSIHSFHAGPSMRGFYIREKKTVTFASLLGIYANVPTLIVVVYWRADSNCHEGTSLRLPKSVCIL